MENLVVLISGKRRSGKTTVARIFQSYGFVMQGFADPLYDLHNKIWFNDTPIGPEHRDLTPKQRVRLINLGGALRAVESDALVRMAASHLNAMWKYPYYSHNAVVPNYRFPNEKHIGRYLEGDTHLHTIRVIRRGYIPDDGLDHDLSETALDNEIFDSTFSVPNGDVEALQRMTARLALELLDRWGR